MRLSATRTNVDARFARKPLVKLGSTGLTLTNNAACGSQCRVEPGQQVVTLPGEQGRLAQWSGCAGDGWSCRFEAKLDGEYPISVVVVDQPSSGPGDNAP